MSEPVAGDTAEPLPRMGDTESHYDFLGLEPGAPTGAIQAAIEDVAESAHRLIDAKQARQLRLRLQQIREDLLTTEQRRRAYDRVLQIHRELREQESSAQESVPPDSTAIQVGGSDGTQRQTPVTGRKMWSSHRGVAVVALVLLVGITLAAGGLRLEWPNIPVASTAAGHWATAAMLRPTIVKTAKKGFATVIRSRQCACDASLQKVETGTLLAADLRTVTHLHSLIQHQETVVHSWRVRRIQLASPTVGNLEVAVRDTEYLYQGVVAVERIDQAYSADYTLTRSAQIWKVSRVRTHITKQRSRYLTSAPSLSAQAALIVDDTTGRTLYAYGAGQERLVASTAKMLTAIVALQHLRLDTVVTVPYEAAAVGGTTANLRAGERMRVRDIFYGMMLPSGNDAAVALADAVSGSQPAFAKLMNAEARRLHMAHSHFVVPHGLDTPGQYSTGHDLALLAHALLQRPYLARVVDTRSYHATSVDGMYAHDWRNLNQLLGVYPGAIGVKTGTTPGAGANLVACVVRGHRRLIAVVLGDTENRRFPDSERLLDYGFKLVKSPPASPSTSASDPVLGINLGNTGRLHIAWRLPRRLESNEFLAQSESPSSAYGVLQKFYGGVGKVVAVDLCTGAVAQTFGMGLPDLRESQGDDLRLAYSGGRLAVATSKAILGFDSASGLLVWRLRGEPRNS